MDDVVRQLDYAPRQAWHKSRRARRIRAAALALFVILLATKFIPPAWRHAQSIYWQNKCMNIALPKDRVVCEWPSTAKNFSAPPARVEEWDRFLSVFSPSQRKLRTVFVHRMERKDGSARLVAVEADPRIRFGDSGYVQLEVQVIEPGNIWTRPRFIQSTVYSLSALHWLNISSHAPRVYAGQLDPDDRSHFIITYIDRGASRSIDGYLQNDDTVLLEPRPQ